MARPVSRRPRALAPDVDPHGPDDARARRRLGDRGHQAAQPEVEIVAVTSFIEEDKVTAALEAGASGYLLKDADADAVANAVRAAHAGEVHLDPAVARLLAQRMRERKTAPQPIEPLTEREKEVLSLVGQGASNKEIASALFITERTARTHVSNILGKLGLSSRTQAALYAVEHKLVTAPNLSQPARTHDVASPTASSVAPRFTTSAGWSGRPRPASFCIGRTHPGAEKGGRRCTDRTEELVQSEAAGPGARDAPAADGRGAARRTPPRRIAAGSSASRDAEPFPLLLPHHAARAAAHHWRRGPFEFPRRTRRQSRAPRSRCRCAPRPPAAPRRRPPRAASVRSRSLPALGPCRTPAQPQLPSGALVERLERLVSSAGPGRPAAPPAAGRAPAAA